MLVIESHTEILIIPSVYNVYQKASTTHYYKRATQVRPTILILCFMTEDGALTHSSENPLSGQNS